MRSLKTGSSSISKKHSWVLTNDFSLGRSSFWLSSLMLLVACNQDHAKSAQATQDLIVPERTASVYVTDQVTIAGQNLSLWFDNGRCQLQSLQPKLTAEPLWLKPTAPCYFIKSPGTDKVQVYQRDKTIRVLAVVGTPEAVGLITKRCGTEVQGLVLNAAGRVSLSHTSIRERLVCAGQGLSNTQYELLAND